MESLSGPLHSRKLSNGNGFSGKNAYEGVFSGQKKFAAPNFSTRVEDYREIFGSSHGSSIPVLDLSGFDDSNGSSKLKSSKPDYSKIFGGFRDDDAVVSYEELFGRVKNSPEKARTPFARRQPSQDSEDLFDTSNQTAEAMKQFNMSYHKTTRRTKDGSNGTTHVAQMHDVPGFTCFVDEIKMAPPKKTEAETQKTSATNGVCPNVDCSEGGPEVKNSKKACEQTSGSAGKSKSRYRRSGSFSDDKLFNAHKINLKSHPSKLPSPSCMPPNLESHRAHSNGPAASNSGASKVDVYVSDEELDVNSAAAASAAALRKAIEKAQESIRIAKESVGRKKEGLRSFLNRSFKDSLKVEEREASDNNVEGTCERVGAASEVIALMERKNACRGGLLQPDFTDGEKLFVARKVIDEIRGKISESARPRERSPLPALELKETEKVPGEVLGETSWKNLESVEEFEAATGSFEWVNAEKGGTVGLAFEPAVNINDILESAVEHESELKEIRTTNETLEAATGSFEWVNAQRGRSVGLAFEPAVNRNDIFESAVECESELKEIRTTNETLEEQAVVKNLETVETACELEDTKRKQNTEVKLHGPESACVVDQERENELPGSKQEEEANMEKPQGFYKLINFVKNLGGFVETMEDDKKVSNKLEDEDFKVRVNDACKFVEDENELKDTQDMMVNEQKEHHYEKRLNQAPELFEIGKQQQQVFEEEYSEKAENENGQGKNCDHDVNEKIVEEVSEWVEHEPKEADESHERKKDDVHKEEAIEKWLEEVHELEMIEKAHTCVHDIEESEVRLQEEFKIKQEDDHKGEETEKSSEERDANDEKESEETLKEKFGWAGHDLRGTEKERGTIQMETDGNEENGEIEIPQKVVYEEIFDRYCDACIAAENQDTHKVKMNDNNMEASLEANDSSPSPRVTKTFCEFKEETAEAVEITNKVQEKEIFEAADQISIEDDEKEFEVKEVDGALSSYDHVVKFGLADKEVGENEIGQIDEQSDLASDGIEMVSNESIEIEELIKEVKIAFFEGKNIPKRAQEEVEGSHLPSMSEEKEKTVEIKEELKRSQYREKTGETLYRTMEEKKAEETEVKRGEEKKQIREMDEATKREREREKDRIAVERAIREARERAFAEARERAERAAVERATAEVRQRVMAEAREKVERVSAGTTKSSSEKASAEAKIRAERAAVERATAEARERALQKAMSQKTTTSEQFVAEKFSGASRDHGTRQSSSSDIHSSNGTNSESAQRNKARLERHNRIMERAANALAEKEKRDMLAQKEQAERNRLAETLDAEIKRWSSGKEGNLRALLSTLQYILGSNSGWQPVSLTEIITTSAVKKAYRKATLVVHPDKLQQRGASIQQKYICEKVFDLLKAAWNKFNSEER